MGRTGFPVHAVPTSAGTDDPTLGDIKRALHELSRTDTAGLREAHDLLRQLARRSGIDPDLAMQGRRALVNLQRARMARASAAGPDQKNG
jgi:hypothetical protein